MVHYLCMTFFSLYVMNDNIGYSDLYYRCYLLLFFNYHNDSLCLYLMIMIRISAGNLATSNYKQIEELTKVITEFATKKDIEQQKQITMNIQLHLTELSNDFNISLNVIDQLSKSQLHCNNRINNLENNLVNKIDRSECDHLESLVAKVMLYDNFKVNSIIALERLDKFQSSTIIQNDSYNNKLKNIHEQLQQVTYDITQTSTKHDTDQLAEHLYQHDNLMKDFASKLVVETLQQQIQSITIKYMNNLTDINNLDKRLSTLDNELIKKASIATVRRDYVTRAHYEQALSTLSSEIEIRANQSTVVVIQNELKVSDIMMCCRIICSVIY